MVDTHVHTLSRPKSNLISDPTFLLSLSLSLSLLTPDSLFSLKVLNPLFQNQTSLFLGGGGGVMPGIWYFMLGYKATMSVIEMRMLRWISRKVVKD